ncbi:MAG TPA: hypothetical protein HPQ00_03195 [Magnetococcales bacterium]|nr:hypothetical protein [Magnetococcales bacterium]
MTKIILVLIATMALGNALFDSGVAGDFIPGLYTVILLALSGLVLYFLRDFFGKGGFGDGENQDKAYGESATESGSRSSSRPVQVIHHEATWAVIAKGRSLGVFKKAPIPAWIRTSDQREADYCGISNVPLPEECTCIEIPERAELIVPPGLIYIVRS